MDKKELVEEILHYFEVLDVNECEEIFDWYGNNEWDGLNIDNYNHKLFIKNLISFLDLNNISSMEELFDEGFCIHVWSKDAYVLISEEEGSIEEKVEKFNCKQMGRLNDLEIDDFNYILTGYEYLVLVWIGY